MKEKTPTQIYNSRKRKRKIFTLSAPIVRILFLVFALVCGVFAVKSSVVNLCDTMNSITYKKVSKKINKEIQDGQYIVYLVNHNLAEEGAIENGIEYKGEHYDYISLDIATSIVIDYNLGQIEEEYGYIETGDTIKLNIPNVLNMFFTTSFYVYCVLTILCLFISQVGGKIILPFVSKKLSQDNQDMVNLEMLKNVEKKG